MSEAGELGHPEVTGRGELIRTARGGEGVGGGTGASARWQSGKRNERKKKKKQSKQ